MIAIINLDFKVVWFFFDENEIIVYERLYNVHCHVIVLVAHSIVQRNSIEVKQDEFIDSSQALTSTPRYEHIFNISLHFFMFIHFKSKVRLCVGTEISAKKTKKKKNKQLRKLYCEIYQIKF